MKMHEERHMAECKETPKSSNGIVLSRLCILKIAIF